MGTVDHHVFSALPSSSLLWIQKQSISLHQNVEPQNHFHGKPVVTGQCRDFLVLCNLWEIFTLSQLIHSLSKDRMKLSPPLRLPSSCARTTHFHYNTCHLSSIEESVCPASSTEFVGSCKEAQYLHFLVCSPLLQPPNPPHKITPST